MKNNIFRIVKMTVLYAFWGIMIQALIVSFLFASSPAEGQNLKDIKVTVKAVNVTFQQALQIIEQKTDFRFNYIQEEIPLKENVTINVTDESLYNILEVFANDYGLIFNRINKQITIKKAEGREKEKITTIVENGSIMGTVKDARTKSPIPNANVLVLGLNIGAAADANGNFLIRNVPPGKYELRVSAIGYGKVSKGLVVLDGKTTEIDFLLDEDAVGLDEVVVTGVAFETKRKEIPADIAIVPPKLIELKGSSNFINLLRGEVPGVFALSNGFSDFNTYIYLRGSGFSGSGNEYAKILLDGIELSQPTYLSTIDPSMIERVEIIRGPHAAALYGSEATAGIIQIFTKKGYNTGLNRPRINASLSAGYIQSEFYGAKVTPDGSLPLQTNSDLALSGGEGSVNYRLGVSYSTMGEWMKNYNSKLLSFSGAASFSQGPFSGEISALYSERRYNQPTQSYLYERWPGSAPVGYQPGMIYQNMKYIFNQNTVGLTLNYQLLPSWIHKITIGYDQNGYDGYQVAPHFLTPADTLQSKLQFKISRTTVRYLTSFSHPFLDDFSLRATLGAEYSKYTTDIFQAVRILLNEFGDLLTNPAGVRLNVLQDRWTSGYNGSLELGYIDRLFFTLSSSVKQDVRGAKDSYTNPPRVGLSYSQPLGDVQFRVRGQIGSAIRPVDPSYINPVSTSANTVYLPNEDLIPEERGGYDAGIDFYWGNNISLSFTRFDELGKNLIQRNLISQQGTVSTYQYVNVGEISIKGFEIQGRFNLGFINLPFLTLSANYSISDNIIEKANNTVVPSPTNFFLPGDRVLGTPKVAGGGSLFAIFDDWTFGLDWNFTGGTRTFDNPAWYDYRYGNAIHRDAGKTYAELGPTFQMDFNGQTVNVSKNSTTRSYVKEWPTYWRFNLHAQYMFNEMFTGFFNLNNVFNETNVEANSLYVNPGRIIELGVKINY